MGMSHANCDHPRTPAGRAACRQLRTKMEPMTDHEIDGVILSPKPGRGSSTRTINSPGVVTGTKRARKPSSVALKRPNTHLRTIGDLPDVPRMLAFGCRLAWDAGWDVVTGPTFNDNEKTIIVNGPVAEITLIWRPSTPDGVWGVRIRPHKHSISSKVADIKTAFRMAGGDEPLPPIYG